MWACRPTPKAVGGVHCTRRVSGRAMRAPTAGELPRRESGPGSGRPYRPPLRENRERVCRGGFYIRPRRIAGSHQGPLGPPVVGATISRPPRPVRPYARYVRRGHNAPVGCGPMWASAPTYVLSARVQSARPGRGRLIAAPTAGELPRWESGPGSGRPYRPPLRENREAGL